MASPTVPTRPPRPRACPPLALLLLALVALPAAGQSELCIEDVAALRQAFASVTGQTTQAVTFKLRTGTYTLDADLELDYRFPGGSSTQDTGMLTLRGGYNAGCSAASNALGATTINGAGGQRRVTIELNNNPFLMEGISSNQIDWRVVNWACRPDLSGIALNVERLRARSTRSFFGGQCHDVTVRNSLFEARSDADFALGFGGTFGNQSAILPRITLVHSTVRNGRTRFGFTADAGANPPPAVVRISSSVFDHTGIELDVEGANLFLLRNRYDSLNLVRGAVLENIGNLSAPPQLLANGLPANGSPLVNAGSQFVPGGLPATDLTGGPRLVGTVPDIGAFETLVDDGFYLDVTNSNGSGAGSLAQAVANLNQNLGRRVIRFNIPGACPRTITLNQTLTLTEGVELRGETQPGSQPSTWAAGYNGVPCVILRAGTGVASGLVFDSSDAGDQFRLTGLAFSGFSGNAVSIRSGRGHLLAGNRFGGSVAGTALAPVGTAIRVEGSAREVQIGGPEPAQTNLIGSAGLGIALQGPGHNQVIGNAIGEAGFQPLGNNTGMAVLSPHNVVAGNWIAQSGSDNLQLVGSQAQHNTVRDNAIFGATRHGVLISASAARNRVGPGNHLGNNGGDGIFLVSGSRSNLSGNTFNGNGGLAIDLAPDGVTPNDPDPDLDHDGSANRNQNFPVLSQATRIFNFPFSFLELTGSFSTTPGLYRFDIYRNNACDGSGHGEGLTLLGTHLYTLSCVATIAGQCTRSFDLLLPIRVAVGDVISVTATSLAGHTSEFSACRTVEQQVVIDPPIFRNGFDPPSLP